MLNNKNNKTILTDVTNEMARPRMAKSARIAELNLDTSRISGQPSSIVPGIVEEIIPSPRRGQPERAQIAIDKADPRYRNLRIENTLTDENGDDVSLKKGAHVKITVTAETHYSPSKAVKSCK